MDRFRYIFLDNWVFPLLRDPKLAAGLIGLIESKRLTVIITSVSMTELYNPGWKEGGDNERGAVAAKFLARVPCVIVDPKRVWDMEVSANLRPLPRLPIELDLAELSNDVREIAILGLLRRDSVYLQQGHDIEAWSLEHKEIKSSWPQSVSNIIENACRNEYLQRDENGRFINLSSTRDLFLYSLDLRRADPSKVDSILADLLRRKKKGIAVRLTSARLISLCFWYSYVDLDRGARPRYNNSDIGDFFQISLLPYCSMFTTDGAMHTLLRRIREKVIPVNCEVLTKALLVERIQQYAAKGMPHELSDLPRRTRGRVEETS